MLVWARRSANVSVEDAAKAVVFCGTKGVPMGRDMAGISDEAGQHAWT